jgi:hypothetical protein
MKLHPSLGNARTTAPFEVCFYPASRGLAIKHTAVHIDWSKSTQTPLDELCLTLSLKQISASSAINLYAKEKDYVCVS